jgi:hypothetical protein
MAEDAGFLVEHAEERPEDIKTHYAKLAEQLEAPPAGLERSAVEKLRVSIHHWQTALSGGHITWACFIVKKPGQT